MTASMIWRWIGASGVAIVLAGCAAITDVPIALSILQSPVRWGGSTGLVNAPLSAEERCRLSRIGEDIRRGQPRGVAVDSWSMSVASRPGAASWPTAASYGHLPTSLPESTCTRGARTNYDRSLTEYVDTFEDLIDKDPIVLVAVSGGGARAASLAASTMSTLERSYNQVAAKLGIEKPRPFFRHVDVYSGVSGGSIYLYSVMVSTSLLDMRDRLHLRDRSGIATKQDASLNCRSDTGITDPFAAFERCFYFAHRSTRDRLYDIGLHSAARYLPFNIVNTLFTDAGYFDVLTLGLGQASKSSSPIWRDSGGWLGNALEALVPFPYPPTLGMLSKRPRVLFNTTALETGLPFVITQSIVHLPSDPLPQPTARLDLVALEERRAAGLPRTGSSEDGSSAKNLLREWVAGARPFGRAATLEEVNSSPARFPAAHAAMASAAFPFGIVPVRIQKYGYEPDRDELFAADSELQLTDGGVFDNSGLYGISSLLDYLTRQRVVRAAAGGGAQTAPRHIIILAINAEADAYDVYSAQGAVRSAAWYQRYPFNLLSVGLPIRTRALGISAINVIHYTNKRRAEELAVRQLASLGRDSGGREEVYFFPVNMAQLSRWDSNALPDPSGLYERYKSIPTRYAIDTKHHVLVSEAVELLVSTPQKTGWAAGKKCGVSKDLSESRGIARHEITRLDEALALTLLRPELDLAVDIGRAGLDSWQQGRCIRWNGEVVAAGPPG